MTQHEQLRDNYEDALFALLVDEFAEQEGKRLLDENERLKQDPDIVILVISDELDKRCVKTIDRALAKEKRRKAKYAAYKIISRVAVAVLAVVVLFGTAYAAFPEVRLRTLNLMIELSDKAASLSLGGGNTSTQGEGSTQSVLNEDGTLRGYRLPNIPEEFNVYYESSTSASARIEYINDNGAIIAFSLIDANGTVVNRDTEGAQNIENIQIRGYNGLLIEKDGWINITWADTDQNKFFTVYCYEISRAVALGYAEAIEFVENS